MNINNGSQNLKKFMKETFATRSVNFDFQGPIFRLFSHKVVRNCYLIFILHRMFFYRDILELTQANYQALTLFRTTSPNFSDTDSNKKKQKQIQI